MTQAAGTRRRLSTTVLDLVWLRQPAEMRVRVSSGNRVRMRSRLERARAVLRLARLGELEQKAALVTQAFNELLTIVGSADESAPLTDGEARDRGAKRVAATLADDALAGTLSELIDGHQSPAPPRGTEGEAIDRLFRLCQWTDWLIDLQSDRERRLRQRLLWTGAVVALILVAYAVFRDKNLALDRTVTASSIAWYTPAPFPGKGPLSRMVDGVRIERTATGVEWAHGTHAGGTEQQLHPWITIDLGRERTINQVVVYNRSDCCWGLNDVPVSLQLSNDNKVFATVATREEEFSDEFPWKQPVGGRSARFVRLWSPSLTPKELILSEIEVYGR